MDSNTGVTLSITDSCAISVSEHSGRATLTLRSRWCCISNVDKFPRSINNMRGRKFFILTDNQSYSDDGEWIILDQNKYILSNRTRSENMWQVVARETIITRMNCGNIILHLPRIEIACFNYRVWWHQYKVRGTMRHQISLVTYAPPRDLLSSEFWIICRPRWLTCLFEFLWDESGPGSNNRIWFSAMGIKSLSLPFLQQAVQWSTKSTAWVTAFWVSPIDRPRPIIFWRLARLYKCSTVQGEF